MQLARFDLLPTLAACCPTACMLHSFRENFYPHDRRNVLLSSDVLCANAFWREEVAGLE
jgi:hypothetical protein